MSFDAIIYSFDEDLTDVHLQDMSIHESVDETSPSLETSEEDKLVTVMQDSSLDFVMIATNDLSTPADYPDVKEEAFEEEGTAEEDFILISEDIPSDSPSGWWNTIQYYAYVAAQEGGQWTNKLVDTTLDKLQSRPSGIHASYDWVSDTQVEGGRLILPGQLISWDDTSGQTLEGLSTSNDPTRRNQSSSVIMVSAYDLLSFQSAKGREWTMTTSLKSKSIPLALVKFAKRTSLHVARKVSHRIQESTVKIKRRVGHVLSPHLAIAMGLVHNGLEWCFPSHDDSSLGTRNRDFFSATGGKQRNIELSTFVDMQDRLTVKEHTLR